MSITESYEVAFGVAIKVKKSIDLPKEVVVYPSAWYNGYFVISIRDASSDVVELIRDNVEEIIKEYPGWFNTRNTSESNLYNIHFEYE